jgi:hypothetical protein
MRSSLAGLTVLVVVVGTAGCAGTEREVRSPAPTGEAPFDTHDGSAGPTDRHQNSPDESSARAPVPCGNLTCGADEYCEIKCTCCGTRIADPSESSASYSCLPLPGECAANSDGLCGGNRTQQVPCA